MTTIHLKGSWQCCWSIPVTQGSLRLVLTFLTFQMLCSILEPNRISRPFYKGRTVLQGRNWQDKMLQLQRLKNLARSQKLEQCWHYDVLYVFIRYFCGIYKKEPKNSRLIYQQHLETPVTPRIERVIRVWPLGHTWLWNVCLPEVGFTAHQHLWELLGSENKYFGNNMELDWGQLKAGVTKLKSKNTMSVQSCLQ